MCSEDGGGSPAPAPGCEATDRSARGGQQPSSTQVRWVKEPNNGLFTPVRKAAYSVGENQLSLGFWNETIQEIEHGQERIKEHKDFACM